MTYGEYSVSISDSEVLDLIEYLRQQKQQLSEKLPLFNGSLLDEDSLKALNAFNALSSMLSDLESQTRAIRGEGYEMVEVS